MGGYLADHWIAIAALGLSLLTGSVQLVQAWRSRNRLGVGVQGFTMFENRGKGGLRHSVGGRAVSVTLANLGPSTVTIRWLSIVSLLDPEAMPLPVDPVVLVDGKGFLIDRSVGDDVGPFTLAPQETYGRAYRLGPGGDEGPVRVRVELLSGRVLHSKPVFDGRTIRRVGWQTRGPLGRWLDSRRAKSTSLLK